MKESQEIKLADGNTFYDYNGIPIKKGDRLIQISFGVGESEGKAGYMPIHLTKALEIANWWLLAEEAEDAKGLSLDDIRSLGFEDEFAIGAVLGAFLPRKTAESITDRGDFDKLINSFFVDNDHKLLSLDIEPEEDKLPF